MTALQQCTGAKFVSERLDLPRPVNNFNQRGTWVQTWTETDLITKNSHYFNFEIGFGRDCEETGVILEPTLWRFDIREQKKKNIQVSHFYPSVTHFGCKPTILPYWTCQV